MKLVAWNCSMALHQKMPALDSLDYDVAVVSETATPDILARNGARLAGTSAVWVGDQPTKGLLVLARNGYTASIDPSYDERNRFVAPVHISGPHSFRLLAVWSHNDRKERGRRKRPGPVLRALESSAEFCRSGDLVVAGDFNNSVVWDRPGRPNNMANIVDALGSLGLVSACHAIQQVDFGREPSPTIYWRNRRRDGPTRHIDYVFIPQAWARRNARFCIGSFEDWVENGLSDHVPLSLTVDPPHERRDLQENSWRSSTMNLDNEDSTPPR